MPIRTKMLAAAAIVASCASLPTDSDHDGQANLPAIVAGMRRACDEMGRYGRSPERQSECRRDTQELLRFNGP